LDNGLYVGNSEAGVLVGAILVAVDGILVAVGSFSEAASVGCASAGDWINVVCF
jgi:hypothetical protein